MLRTPPHTETFRAFACHRGSEVNRQVMKHLVLIPLRSPLDSVPVAEMTLPLYTSSEKLERQLTKYSRVLPKPIEWYSDNGIIEADRDDLGHKLTFVTAANAAIALASESDVLNSEWDMAIVSLLQALPDSTRVVIWWHGST